MTNHTDYMNRRESAKSIQGPSTNFQGDREYLRLQNLVEDECGVRCTIVVRPHCVSVRTVDYTDFVLARSILIKRGTSKPVVRDLEAKEP